MVEPIFRDPGNIGFQWMEIQRTRASQIQQLEMHTNFSLNDTLNEFGFIPRETECEHKCPELDACIAGNLWCDGELNIFFLAAFFFLHAFLQRSSLFLINNFNSPLATMEMILR